VPFTADNADGVETVAGAGRRGRVDVIRPGAAEGEQGMLLLLRGRDEIVFELAPLVAAKRGIGQVFTLDEQLDAGAVEQAGFKLL
jgi:hypothetical protein